jgi:predicted adenine nucleotide alpha hydrolase (AANH) superfamily ATPase
MALSCRWYVAADVGIPFLYRDFREGWKEGQDASRELGLYRQKYCGCVYSEKERYVKKQPVPEKVLADTEE